MPTLTNNSKNRSDLVIETTRCMDLDCVQIGNSFLSLLITQSIGPRIISLKMRNGENIFAELPDFTLDCPGEGPFHIRGGHRLWFAPEVPEVTYLPDDDPVKITASNNGLTVVQSIEDKTGIQKSLEVQLPNDGPIVIIDHLLKNTSDSDRICAPWAITQLKPGGIAILPQNTEFADPNGLQPNRSVALWPYTDVNSENITWGNRAILVRAPLRDGALKLGFANRQQWLAYQLDPYLFVKYASYEEGEEYFDLGASSQCYCNDQFLELETLGPKRRLKPGQTVRHREIWQIHKNLQLDLSQDEFDAASDLPFLSGGLAYLN